MVPAPFRLVFAIVPLFVAAVALTMAALPHRLVSMRQYGSSNAARREPSGTLITLLRVGAAVVALVALAIAYVSVTALP